MELTVIRRGRKQKLKEKEQKPVTAEEEIAVPEQQDEITVWAQFMELI